MAKSKSSAASKIKLTNKSANKRMKSKHRQSRSQKTQTQVNSLNFGKVTNTRKEKNNRNIKSLPLLRSQHDHEMPGEISEDELAFSDEEMLEYVNKNSRRMSLLSSDFTNDDTHNKKKSNKGKGENAIYENVPRTFTKGYDKDLHCKDKVDLLPLKGDTGLIQRSREIDETPVHNMEEGHVNKEDPCIPAVNENESPKTNALSVLEIMANHRIDMNAKKVKIAQLSQEIIESPAKVGSLKELIALCRRDQVAAIQKLSLLSLVEVFKDIIPSYRIRELTEQEHAIKVSRDVCALREFENALLSNYKMYLTLLEDNVKYCMKMLKKKHIGEKSKEGTINTLVSIATTSVNCLCELLLAASHFNFRSNIIAVIVPKIGLSGSLKDIGTACFDGVKSALIADKLGDVSLEIVKVINKEVKSKVHVKPKLLEVLLYLQLDSDAIKAAEEQGNKMQRLAKKREAIMKMSKKEKRKKKFEDQLNKEMQEVEAVENRDNVQRVQTDILKFLFVIYFRIMKADHVSSLIPVVLQGLAKFAHLINVEFFHDLMAAIEKILKTEDIGLNESLNCIRAAMKILSGQGEILAIDPRQFYSELYSQLTFISADSSAEDIAVAKNCVEEMILKRKKQVSMVKVKGFFKRLSTILLQLKSENVIEYSLLLRNILQVHNKCDHLLDNDTCSQGIFQPDVPDPEYCNAGSTAVWELNLLSTHYNPQLNVVSKHILDGAPSQGAGSLPSKILAKNSIYHDTTDGLHDYFPDFINSNPASKCFCSTNVNTWKNEALQLISQEQISSLIESVDTIIDNLYPVV